ncbi:MAG TPA: MFS transporter, partial [Microbacterium sp.]|nr:MFS transporter [Microbacterium sp.]
GPFIGAAVIVGANETFEDLGVTKQGPTPWIFLAAAVVALFVIVPVMWLRTLPASPNAMAETPARAASDAAS